ncbi:urease accessory protein UreD, partial [uncultured Treponema sp.]|uniref:urease accessory protein UreD n=1 Tax=uncultured Treponema sp. TaxID=162155 RepID=UPI0025FD9A3F
GGITVFQQSASPGILAGDAQKHNIIVEKGANLEIVSQSFEKIFKMEEGEKAERKISASVGEGGTLIYAPNPCIPFAKSNFVSSTKISLSAGAKLIYEDCICAGRVACGEVFDFRAFKNLIEIRREEKLIFRENSFFEGGEKKNLLQSKVSFGDFTHSGTMLIFGFEKTVREVREILGLEEKLLYTEEYRRKACRVGKEPGAKEKILIEASESDSGDIVVRMLGKSAQEIQGAFQGIIMHLQ